jgi:putative ABC transport system permease protein
MQRLTWTIRLGLVLLFLGVLGWAALFTSIAPPGADSQATTNQGISLVAHMLVLFGALLIIPGLLVRGFTWLRCRVKMCFGLAVSLALSTLQRQPLRAARTASILTIVVAATLMGMGIGNAMTAAVSYLLRGFFNPDYVIVSKGGDNSFSLMDVVSGRPFIPTDPRFYTALDALHDKLFISRIAMNSIQYPELTLLPGMPGFMIFDIDDYVQQRGAPLVGATLEEIRATFAAGPAIILAQGIADHQKLKVGDTFTLNTATGPLQFKVAAIEARFFSSYLDYRQAPAALGGITPFGILLKRKPGVSAADVEPALNAIASQYGLRFTRMTEYSGAFLGFYASLGTAFSAIGVLTMIIAALGILNTVYTSVFERRRELGVLAAVGGTPGQLRRMILAEAVILGIGGAVPGAIVGALLAASWGPLNALAAQIAPSEEAFGAFAIPWLPLIVMLVGAPLVAILAALIPARHITRLPIVETLHYQ